MKSYVITAVVAIVAVALIYRIPAAKAVVFGA
jgi:hypothetical protein